MKQTTYNEFSSYIETSGDDIVAISTCFMKEWKRIWCRRRWDMKIKGYTKVEKMNLKGSLRKEKIFFLDSGNMLYIPSHFFLVIFPVCGALRLDMSLLRHEWFIVIAAWIFIWNIEFSSLATGAPRLICSLMMCRWHRRVALTNDRLLIVLAENQCHSVDRGGVSTFISGYACNILFCAVNVTFNIEYEGTLNWKSYYYKYYLLLLFYLFWYCL